MPDARRWGDAAVELMNLVIDARQGVESPLNVNVVFQMHGEVFSPDFEGVRTGRFSRRHRHLMIQAPSLPTPTSLMLEQF